MVDTDVEKEEEPEVPEVLEVPVEAEEGAAVDEVSWGHGWGQKGDIYNA